MKITIPAGPLAHAARLANGATDLKETKKFAALGAAQIRGAETGTVLVVNNLDRMIAVAVDAHVETPGAIAVDCERFAKLVDALPSGDSVTIEQSDENVGELKSGRRKYKLAVIPGGDLPQDLQITDETGAVTLPRADALALFGRTAFASVSPKDSRVHLRGIFLHHVDGELIAVATDGTMLARFGVAARTALASDRHLIVPSLTAELVIRLLADKAIGVVTLRCSRTLFGVEVGGLRLVSRILDATFPDYQRVIPKLPAGGATVAHADLLAALERVCAVDSGRRLRLEWTNVAPIELRLQAIDSDTFDDVVTAKVAAYGTAACDAHKLRDLVKELPGKELTLAVGEPGEPLHISVPDIDRFFAILAQINVKAVPP